MKFSRLLGLGAALLMMHPVGSAVAREAKGEAPTAAGIEKSDFFDPGFAPTRNGQAYDITIVYFFDYQCPTCRKYHADVARVLSEDRRVRIIYRDTPMLGDRSDAAAHAAIASRFQGRHEAMHNALMSTSGSLDGAALRAAADKAGVDWYRLQRDIKGHKSRIDELITWNFELATTAGIYGTPAFIVGDALANGALDYDGLKGEIADARKSLGSAPTQTITRTTDAHSRSKEEIREAGPAEADSPTTPATRPAPVFRQSSAEPSSSARTSEADVRGRRPLNWLAAAAGLLAALAAGYAWRRRGTSADAEAS